jgi:hypothetical protein
MLLPRIPTDRKEKYKTIRKVCQKLFSLDFKNMDIQIQKGFPTVLKINIDKLANNLEEKTFVASRFWAEECSFSQIIGIIRTEIGYA